VRAIEWTEKTLGPNHPRAAEDLTEQAMLCRQLKEYGRGLAILQSLSPRQRSQRDADPLIADNFSRIALFHMDEKRPEQAASALRTALLIREKSMGTEHAGLLPELERLAAILLTLREDEKAELVFRRILVIRERALGPSSPDLIPAVEGLAYACFGQRKFAEAEPLYLRLLGLWRGVGQNHPMVAMTLDKLAVFYREQGRAEESAAAMTRSNAIRALFFAEGVAEEAYALMQRGAKAEAARRYRKALAALDPAEKSHEELRAQIEMNWKALAGAAPKKAAPGAKKR
jgi:tetratricopeptide (TPR) repeat protein